MDRRIIKAAQYCGVDRGHISRIWAGKAKPSVLVAWNLAKFYGISVGELLYQLDIVEST